MVSSDFSWAPVPFPVLSLSMEQALVVKLVVCGAAIIAVILYFIVYD